MLTNQLVWDLAYLMNKLRQSLYFLSPVQTLLNYNDFSIRPDVATIQLFFATVEHAQDQLLQEGKGREVGVRPKGSRFGQPLLRLAPVAGIPSGGRGSSLQASLE